VPGLQLVQQQAGAPLLTELREYVRASAGLSQAQNAAALDGLLALLPDPAAAGSAPIPKRGPGARTPLADDATHDRYFGVLRVDAPEGAAFLRTLLGAALLFHAEMHYAYAETDAGRFAAVGAAIRSALGFVAEVPVATVVHEGASLSTPAQAPDPMHRWMLGHQVFAALTQGIIFALQAFEDAMRSLDERRAGHALRLCADLLTGSATAFRFTADFGAAAYAEVVRPSMMGPQLGEGFSGLLSVDHRRLVTVLNRARPLMALTAESLAVEQRQVRMALDHVYSDHKFVCARFGGSEVPSLRCPNSSPLPGTEQLDRYHRARAELLQPGSNPGTTIVL
jgi:hypothetical protein